MHVFIWRTACIDYYEEEFDKNIASTHAHTYIYSLTCATERRDNRMLRSHWMENSGVIRAAGLAGWGIRFMSLATP